MLVREACNEVVKPEWWNDEGIKALSARVVRAAPNNVVAIAMRGMVLCGRWSSGAKEAWPRSTAELEKAAAHFERAAALCPAHQRGKPISRFERACATDGRWGWPCSCLRGAY